MGAHCPLHPRSAPRSTRAQAATFPGSLRPGPRLIRKHRPPRRACSPLRQAPPALTLRIVWPLRPPRPPAAPHCDHRLDRFRAAGLSLSPLTGRVALSADLWGFYPAPTPQNDPLALTTVTKTFGWPQRAAWPDPDSALAIPPALGHPCGPRCPVLAPLRALPPGASRCPQQPCAAPADQHGVPEAPRWASPGRRARRGASPSLAPRTGEGRAGRSDPSSPSPVRCPSPTTAPGSEQSPVACGSSGPRQDTPAGSPSPCPSLAAAHSLENPGKRWPCAHR